MKAKLAAVAFLVLLMALVPVALFTQTNGSPGRPSLDVVSVQGVTGMTAVHTICDSGCGPGGSSTITGDKTNNSAAPNGTNVGVLPGLANAADPSWTEGRQVLQSMTLAGYLRTASQGLAPTNSLRSIAGNPFVVAGSTGISTKDLFIDSSGRLYTSGALTHNNAAPAATTNYGVLFGLANAAAPTYTEGNQVLASLDLGGKLRTLTTPAADSVVQAKYGTSNQSITITLASLAASATVCRASTVVDNSSNLFLDAIVSGLVETGTVAANFQVLIYAYGTANGGTNYSGANGANTISGTDAGFTRSNPTDLKLIGVLPTPTNSVVMGWGPYSVAQAFGGMLPDHWGIVVCNDTGATLSATAGNNKAFYQGIQANLH